MPHKDIKGIPSVTQILSVIAKPGLYRWYALNGWDKCERIKRESAEFGTLIHGFIGRWLQEQDDSTSHFLQTEFMRVYKPLKLEVVEVEPEEPYRSKKYGYQGTFDWIDKDLDGEIWINDLKVTSKIYEENGLQLAAYAQLYNENKGTKITKGKIYRLDKKTGKLQIKEFLDLPKYFKIFKCLIPVWKWINK